MNARPYMVLWDREEPRRFASFRAAETHARRCAATLDERGFSDPARIHYLGGDDTVPYWFRPLAEVRLDGCGRVWTDLTDAGARLPL